MRPIAGICAGLVAALVLAGCGSSKQGWSTPDDVLSGVKAAGFDCVLPTSDTTGQVLTTDPFTGADLAGNSLVRCPSFQVMLAKDSVEAGFATLVKCQAVPQSIRESAEWSAAIVVGPNFVILPADLSKGWVTGAQPGDMTKAFGGSTTTFGELYDTSCAGAVASAVPSSAGASSGGTSTEPSPVATSTVNPFSSPSPVPSAS